MPKGTIWQAIGARPWIGLVENPDPEMKNPVAGPGFLLGLEKIGNLMVDGYSLGPTGGGIRTSLDVSGVKLDARKQTAHAPHVVVPVAPHLVVEVLEEEEEEPKLDPQDRDPGRGLVGVELCGMIRRGELFVL